MSSASEILISRLIKTNGPLETQCWIYHGPESGRYGSVRHNNQKYKAHRLAYTIWKGPIPHTMNVCHNCDTPMCCNPEHLFLGTQQDNVDDMMAKGRHVASTGENNGRATISDETVLIIREMLIRGVPTHNIKLKYGVSKYVIYNIKHGRKWRHI